MSANFWDIPRRNPSRVKCKESTEADVKISKVLSKEHEMQVMELLEEIQDVLTHIPGETNLLKHRINLTSEQSVRI